MSRYPPHILEGIDTSGYQGMVNWQQAHREGRKSFGIVKGTEGLQFRDEYFGHSWQALHALNMPRMVYAFLYSHLSGVEQADYLHGYVEAGHQFRHTDAVVTDLEEGYVADAASGIRCLEGFITRMRYTYHLPVMIYTNYDTWVNLLGNPDKPLFRSCPLWLADLGPGVPRLAPWPAGPSFVQYSFHGHCPGVAGEVDMDRFYGSLQQLRTLFSVVPHDR